MCNIMIKEVGYLCEECYSIINARIGDKQMSKQALIIEVEKILNNMPYYKQNTSLSAITWRDE